MAKKKYTFYLDKKFDNFLSPFRFYKSTLVEIALEILFEKIQKQQMIQIMIEAQNTEDFKKKIKELFKGGSNDNTIQNEPYFKHHQEQKPERKSKDEILKRFKDFL